MWNTFSQFVFNEDLLLNLFSEGIGILFTILITSPLVSWIVAKRQARNERNERVKMIPHLKHSYSLIHQILLSVENGSDADFIEAGFEVVRRKIGGQMSSGPYNPSYEFALGNPDFIFRTIKQKIDTQVRYINSLIGLFAPHFRTADAYLAMEYLEKLRDPSQDLNEILQRIQWLISSVEAFEKFGGHLSAVEETEETGGQEGVKTRDSVINQMRENIEKSLNEIFTKYKSLDNRARAIEKTLNRFISALETP